MTTDPTIAIIRAIEEANANGDRVLARSLTTTLHKMLTDAPVASPSDDASSTDATDDASNGDAPDASSTDAPDTGDAAAGDSDGDAAGADASGGDGAEGAATLDEPDDDSDGDGAGYEDLTSAHEVYMVKDPVLKKVRTHDGAQRDINQQSKRLRSIFDNALSFTDNDEGGWLDGERTGRLRSKGAVAVATGDDSPFSVRATPKEPNRVLVILLVDVSQSMSSVYRRDSRARGAACVAHALHGSISEHQHIDLCTVRYATLASVCEPTAEGLYASSSGNGHCGCGTNADTALMEARKTDAYQRALANGDAIIGVCITDGDFAWECHQNLRVLLEGSASAERWTCVYVSHDHQHLPPMRDTFGEGNVALAPEGAMHVGPEIARGIQKTIEYAEARRG